LTEGQKSNRVFSEMASILVIDTESFIREVLRNLFESEKHDVALASSGREAKKLLGKNAFDLIFLDIMLKDMDGLELLRNMPPLNAETPVVVITGFATVKSAVKAMKLGAFDYISKPFSLEEVLLVAEKALEYSQVKRENLLLKRHLRRHYSLRQIIGSSEAMRRVFALIEKVKRTDSTVLITGESGTGKELVAKTIHYQSPRANGPFVAINCAAIPRELLEAELFGYEKGAFTGAVVSKPGKLEMADTGTLFLDEVAELDPALQGKLLRVIQEREFERIGSNKTIRVDVRIIAASNRDLQEQMRQGRFREDLYWRLNVIPIHLPPLRERKEDIPALLGYFVQELSQQKRGRPIKFSHDALKALMAYHWPGNVRELENLVERLMVLHEGDVVSAQDLPSPLGLRPAEISPRGQVLLSLPSEGVNLPQLLQELESQLILQALERSGGVRSKAARLLGLNRTTLIEKMKKLGLAEALRR